jgi:hypothetical protein
LFHGRGILKSVRRQSVY